MSGKIFWKIRKLNVRVTCGNDMNISGVFFILVSAYLGLLNDLVVSDTTF